MKVGFITHQYPGVRGGGIGTYAVQAAQALAARGHEVHLFTFTLPDGVTRPAGVHLHEVADAAERAAAGTLPGPVAGLIDSGSEAHYRLALGWLLCAAAREFHQAHGLDVIEVPEYEALGLPLLLQEDAERPAVVVHLHLCSAVARAGNLGRNEGGKNVKGVVDAEEERIDALEFAGMALADGLCAPSQSIVEETRRFSAIDREVTILPHPLSVPETCTDAPDNGPVLFVGRLEPRKGTDLMPAAFNEFLMRNPDAVVRLVGSDTQWGGERRGGGSARARIEAALDPGVRGRVIFAGEKSPEEVGREFVACRFSICPSLLESFGYVAAESMIAGRAVVVGEGTGATELVGPAGIAFARGDAPGLAAAMEKMWREHALCGELGRKAFVLARELFSPERMVDQRVAFYRRVIEGRGRVVRDRGKLNIPHREILEDAIRRMNRGVSTPLADTPGARLLRLFEQINPAGAQVILYGAGRFTARLLAQRHLWETHGHRVVSLIDDHPRYVGGGMWLGLPVWTRGTVLACAQAGEKTPPIVLSTDTFEEQFWRQTQELRALGIRVYRLPH